MMALPTRNIDGLVSLTRRIADAGTQNCENNPMHSINWASHPSDNARSSSPGMRKKRPQQPKLQ